MIALKNEQAHYIIVDGKRLPLIIVKHPRARHMVLRYDRRNDSVRLTLPRRASLKRGIEFAHGRAAWVENQRMNSRAVAFADGVVIPLLGHHVTLRHQGGRGLVTRVDDELHIPGDAAFMTRRVLDYIRKELQARATDIAEKYASRLGVTVASLRIADTRSRWGSCSHKGALSICLRLAFAPPEILDYVVCHEVAHIRHLNHSDAFWASVEALCPDYRRHEAWLVAHGQSLWVYG